MGLEYNTEPNGDTFIRLQLSASDTGLYPQAKIYAISAPTTVVDTVNLDEIGNGLYGATWTNNGIKTKYFTQTIVYRDSDHTLVHPIIRPDSDSINIGFNTSGFAFGGKSKSTVYKHKLTKEEIEKIAKACYKLLLPELKKKSEFNPSKDKVKTDIKIPKAEKVEIPPIPTTYDIAKAVVKNIKFPKQEKVVIPPMPSIEDFKNATKEIYKEFDYSKFDELAKIIKDNKTIVPEQIDYSKNIESIEDALKSVVAPVLLKGVVNKLGKDITKKDVFKAISNKEGAFSIYQLFKQLSDKDKADVFEVLAISNKKLLKELAKLAEVDRAMEDINKSDNKESTFKSLLAKGKINRDMLPLIKLFKQNAR